MRTRLTSGIVAGIMGIAVLVPAVGLADRGGHPHTTKPCPVHRHHGRHRGDTHGHKRGFDKGRKCGFNRTGQTGNTGQTGHTGETGETH